MRRHIPLANPNLGRVRTFYFLNRLLRRRLRKRSNPFGKRSNPFAERRVFRFPPVEAQGLVMRTDALEQRLSKPHVISGSRATLRVS